MKMTAACTTAVFALLCALCLTCSSARDPDESDINSRLEGEHHYGGDILLTEEQRATIEATSNSNDPFGPQNAVVRTMRSTWPGGVVPYVIYNSLGERAKNAIHAAIATYDEETCIRFIPRTSERDYVFFYRGTGCLSYIGRIGGPQSISIGSGCDYKGIVMHEMFHALGRWHEQSRPDRDVYISVNPDNMRSGVESNFKTVSTAFVTTQGVPYDLRSIMHYGAYAFSRNGKPTIEPLNKNVSLSIMGQRIKLSVLDLEHLSALYCKDDATPPGSWSEWGSWSSCSRTCNGGMKRRTRECLGGVACPGSNVVSQMCNTDACPDSATWSRWGQWSGCSATCGGGRQTRVRRCINGSTCVGRSAEYRDCGTQGCPQPASWSSWSSWSSCSQTCQGGTWSRRRRCQNGNSCPGAAFEVDHCNSNVPCNSTTPSLPPPSSTAPPSSGSWSEWSECTKTCGNGMRFRVRECGGSDCESEQEDCNTQDCNPEPNLQGLAHIGCYYVPRFNSPLGLLEGSDEELADNPATRVDPIRKCGRVAQLQGYHYFAISAGYCISGSNSIYDYRYVVARFCNHGVGGYSGGYHVMDVYEITDALAFQDSAGIVVDPSATLASMSVTEYIGDGLTATSSVERVPMPSATAVAVPGESIENSSSVTVIPTFTTLCFLSVVLTLIRMY